MSVISTRMLTDAINGFAKQFNAHVAQKRLISLLTVVTCVMLLDVAAAAQQGENRNIAPIA
jgi:hypothetical protein